MINYAIITDYKDKFAGVISQDITSGKIFYKVRTKLLDSLLEQLFQNTFYRDEDQDDLFIISPVSKYDKDYLEIALSNFDGYKINEYYEEVDGDYHAMVRNVYAEKLK